MSEDRTLKEQEQTAHSLRNFVFFSVALTTMATICSAFAIPLAYTQMQHWQSAMQSDLEFCRARGGNIWREVVRTQILAKVMPKRRQRRDIGISSLNYDGNGGPSNYPPSLAPIHGGPDHSYDSHEDHPVEQAHHEASAPHGGQCCGCGVSPRGPAGPPGPEGPPGKDGRQGKSGNPGPEGPPPKPAPKPQWCFDCPQAHPGPQGKPGPPGALGNKGRPGPVGPKPLPGPLGPVGEPGPEGPPGPPGQEGHYGHPGRVIEGPVKVGPPGPAGPAGPQGPQGPEGQDGNPGKEGEAGEQGETGPEGETGKDGAPGEEGMPGLKGIEGSCDHCPQPRTGPGY